MSDINECKERSACQCDGCSCQNTWGGFECKCKGNLLYIKEQDACIGKTRNSNDYPQLLCVENFHRKIDVFYELLSHDFVSDWMISHTPLSFGCLMYVLL